MEAFYPLQFEPILKDRIWGGTKLASELGKQISGDRVGESWELSAVEDDVSIVSNGIFKGERFDALIRKYPIEILGSDVHERFGAEFPLLFKFLDAREDLSIQVHPNDALAKQRHNSFGKTEMWYVMQAEPGARIIVGFREKSSPEEYLKELGQSNLESILNAIAVKQGDVFFLETGTIHAIGGGILIAEIQQTSDVTYRVYDWDRRDSEGKGRELHTEQALDAISYEKANSRRTYSKQVNESNLVVDCPFFTTNLIPLEGSIDVVAPGSSFTVFMCTEGGFAIEASGTEYSFKKGDTILIPAALTQYTIKGRATLLEIYIS